MGTKTIPLGLGPKFGYGLYRVLGLGAFLGKQSFQYQNPASRQVNSTILMHTLLLT